MTSLEQVSQIMVLNVGNVHTIFIKKLFTQSAANNTIQKFGYD
jgi:hypothetical protein